MIGESSPSLSRMAGHALKEIAGVRSFFKARGTINPSQDPVLQKSFAESLLSIINGVKPFGPTEGTQVIEALHDCPYGEVQTKRICEYVDSRMQQSIPSPTPTPGVHKQVLKHWWNYCTGSDWALLKNPKISFNQKMTTLVERGLSIGCLDPDEQSLRWLLATLLLVHYDEFPGPTVAHKKLQDLKASYAAERKMFLHEQLPRFPENPRELPSHISRDAYGDEWPNTVELHGVNTVAESIPLRSNSRLLKKRRSCPEMIGAFKRTKNELAAPEVQSQASRGREAMAQYQSSDDMHDEMLLFLEYQEKVRELQEKKSGATKSLQNPCPGGHHQHLLRRQCCQSIGAAMEP